MPSLLLVAQCWNIFLATVKWEFTAYSFYNYILTRIWLYELLNTLKQIHAQNRGFIFSTNIIGIYWSRQKAEKWLDKFVWVFGYCFSLPKSLLPLKYIPISIHSRWTHLLLSALPDLLHSKHKKQTRWQVSVLAQPSKNEGGGQVEQMIRRKSWILRI